MAKLHRGLGTRYAPAGECEDMRMPSDISGRDECISRRECHLRRRAHVWSLLFHSVRAVTGRMARLAQPSHQLIGCPCASPGRLSTARWVARRSQQELRRWPRWRGRWAGLRSEHSYWVLYGELRGDGAFPSSCAVGLVLSSGGKVARRWPSSKGLEFILLEMICH
jgi:hypothetical protein